jgi:hypothetical protein
MKRSIRHNYRDRRHVDRDVDVTEHAVQRSAPALRIELPELELATAAVVPIFPISATYPGGCLIGGDEAAGSGSAADIESAAPTSVRLSSSTALNVSNYELVPKGLIRKARYCLSAGRSPFSR